MISNIVYQLGFASFNFPFAAVLCVAGAGAHLGGLAVLRHRPRALERIGAALMPSARARACGSWSGPGP